MKNVLRYKHQKNKGISKSKHLKKRYSPQIFLFYIPILRYQIPNEMMNKIFNLSMFFFANNFMNNFTNLVVNSTQSE